MPIISFFPGGAGSGGGLALSAVSGIATVVSHGKAYFKWTDPDDLVVADSTLAAFAGTLLVRKAGSAPASRRDGTIVLDSKTRNAYQNTYFCDSGLTDGVTYYYKFFTYTTQDAYTDSPENLVEVTPVSVAPGDVFALSVAAAGNGKATLRWTDPGNTVQDGITTVVWGGSKVVYKKGSRPTGVDDGTLVLNSTTKNAYRSAGLTISGLENGATYYFAVFPYGTDAYGGAVNTSTDNIISGVPNRLTIANVPSQSGSLTYTGSAQTPSWNGYDSQEMTMSVTAQTNAGTYSATFTPRDDYMWSDGTTSAKSVSWKIGKAAGTLTVDKTSVLLNMTTLTDTITIGGNHDGTVSVVSSAAGIATATVEGSVITVSHVNQTTGTAVLTISCDAGVNYTATEDVTVNVTAAFISRVLNDNSWEVISSVSAKNEGANYWSVGDCKEITINGTVGTLAVNGTYCVYIIGFNHNSSKEGNGITFGTFKTSLSGGVDVCLVDSRYRRNTQDQTKCFNMNHSASTGDTYWIGCDMRYDILGSTNTTGGNASATTATNPVANTLMAALPQDLRAVMKPMNIYTCSKFGGFSPSAIKQVPDYLPLLAEYEVFGARTKADQYEKNYQEQYAYYAAGNSWLKHRHDDSSSDAVFWWLRSPSSGSASSTLFCCVGWTGDARSEIDYYSCGIAPIFRV